LVSHTEGSIEVEGERENGAEQDISTKEGGSQISLEKVA
jgi:hypothetical protein